jgi:hypothetical protein
VTSFGSTAAVRRIEYIRCIQMNWLVLVLVGGAAAWFEYNYHRSRHGKTSAVAKQSRKHPVPETAHVEKLGATPSISPGSENDKKLNTTV